MNDVKRIVAETSGLSDSQAIAKRKEILKEMEETRALPKQALIGVAINNAVRMSADAGGKFMVFDENMNISFE